MKRIDLIIVDPIGLHARPVSVFVKAAKAFEADVGLQHGDKTANAKSLISVLQLGAHTGEQISLTIEGPDEDEAFTALQTLFTNELEEEFSLA